MPRALAHLEQGFGSGRWQTPALYASALWLHARFTTPPGVHQAPLLASKAALLTRLQGSPDAERVALVAGQYPAFGHSSRVEGGSGRGGADGGAGGGV